MGPELSDSDPHAGGLPAPVDSASRPPWFRLPFWSERWPEWSRGLAAQSSKLAFVFVAGAIFIFGRYAHHIHHLGDWLTLFWARAWLGVALFGFASLAIGLRLLALLKMQAGSLLERTSLAFAVGVLTFALGIFVSGLFGLLNKTFFLAWPGLLLLLGHRSLLRYFRGLARLRARFGAALFFPQDLFQALAALTIAAGTFALYTHVLSPSSIGFDTKWYHIPIAEHYVAAGRIRPFAEGWYLGAYPHLGSWLYTWAFLAPGVLRHHLCLAAHLEFALFLLTIVNTSALASRLISGPRLRYGGAALFLFPAILNASGSLGTGSDHVLEFWAAPVGLALLHYLRKPDVRHGALLGMVLGGAVLSKYQALYFFVPVALVLAFNLAQKRKFGALLSAAGVALLVTSPHWLKNLIAYGDPFYPNLYRWLPDHPLFPGAVEIMRRSYWYTGDSPSLSGWARVKDTLIAVFKFSFYPLSWARVHDDATVVGSLFTLLLPVMLWVRPRWRVLLLAGCVYVALAIWWNSYPDARYLQAIMPWMAACVAATLAAAWRTKSVALRAAVVTLVALQIVWGGDSYLLRSKDALAELPLRALSFDKENPFPRNPYPGENLAAIGERLPKGSKIIGHDFYQSMGAGVQAATDNPDWQGTIDYLQIDEPDRVLEHWRALGATHLVWPFTKEPRRLEDIARDTVFGRASVAFTDSAFDVSGYRVAEIIDRPAPESMQNPTMIAWLACGTERALGVYTPAGLANGTLVKPLSNDDLKRDPSAALADVNTLWFFWKCEDSQAILPIISEQFTKVLVTGDDELWVRIPPDAEKVRPRDEARPPKKKKRKK